MTSKAAKLAIREDLKRRGDEGIRGILLPEPQVVFMRFFRKAQHANTRISELWWSLRLKLYSNKTHIQIPADTKIGRGLHLGHHGTYVINGSAIIGDNCNLSSGCVIGKENRGRREGCPELGNRVWVGANAVVVGKIKVGDDVLIAPNSYVNFDVPSHSIVIGNPAKIINKNNATEGYINNCV